MRALAPGCVRLAAEASLCSGGCRCVLSEFGRGPEGPAVRPASLFPVPVTPPVHSFHTQFDGHYLHTEPKGKGLQEETKSMRNYTQQLPWEHVHNSVIGITKWIACKKPACYRNLFLKRIILSTPCSAPNYPEGYA